MTIQKGREWGCDQPAPSDLRDIEDDEEYGRLVDTCRRATVGIPPCTLRHGSLARTIGGTGRAADDTRSTVRVLPIDIGRATLDGTDHWFAAHLIARRSWWFGPVIAVMNAEFVGRWDVAPRSHPNDGRLDVIEASPVLPLGQRWRARARLPTGDHVPHPLISERRLKQAEWQFGRPVRIWLDGRPYGRVRQLRVTVEADAAQLCL